MGKIAETDAYIENAQEFAKPILNHIRTILHKECPDIQEVIKWGFPCFESEGYMCGMQAHKNHCSFIFHKGTLMKDPDNILEIVGKTGMGSLGKLKSLDDLPSDEVLAKYIQDAVAINASGQKVARPKPKKKVDLEISDFFMNELSSDASALETFQNFSMSNKRDYVEWVDGAKTEATRDRRMAQAVEWMAEGKVRNWKYIRK